MADIELRRHGEKQRATIPDLVIGTLPHVVINRCLGLELEAGNVVLTRGAQRHAAKRHPKEYAMCLPQIASVVVRPLYVGDDFKNSGKIELIGRIRAASISILVAVNVRRDEHGNYHIESFYPVSDEKINNRRRKGFLRVV